MIARINIGKNKSVLLFYKFKELGYLVTRLNAIVQNPDFADTRDIELFKEECEKFEKEYKEAKRDTIELFQQ